MLQPDGSVLVDSSPICWEFSFVKQVPFKLSALLMNIHPTSSALWIHEHIPHSSRCYHESANGCFPPLSLLLGAGRGQLDSAGFVAAMESGDSGQKWSLTLLNFSLYNRHPFPPLGSASLCQYWLSQSKSRTPRAANVSVTKHLLLPQPRPSLACLLANSRRELWVTFWVATLVGREASVTKYIKRADH